MIPYEIMIAQAFEEAGDWDDEPNTLALDTSLFEEIKQWDNYDDGTRHNEGAGQFNASNRPQAKPKYDGVPVLHDATLDGTEYSFRIDCSRVKIYGNERTYKLTYDSPPAKD